MLDGVAAEGQKHNKAMEKRYRKPGGLVGALNDHVKKALVGDAQVSLLGLDVSDSPDFGLAFGLPRWSAERRSVRSGRPCEPRSNTPSRAGNLFGSAVDRVLYCLFKPPKRVRSPAVCSILRDFSVTSSLHREVETEYRRGC